MKRFNLTLVMRAGLAITAFVAVAVHAQDKDSTWLVTHFQARTHFSPITMVYRLYVPTGYNPAQKYPIVVALHGDGGAGNDNLTQLIPNILVQPWVRDSVQVAHPSFVMVPQYPSGNNWARSPWDRTTSNIGIGQILDSLKREFSLDTTRFYVIGFSRGAFGAISLMKWEPGRFAAAVPAAGDGDKSAAAIAEMIKTPMWAFHGNADANAPVSNSRTIVNLMEAQIGKPFVRFISSKYMANPTAISVDSLRKAVYSNNADFLYSEITGGSHDDGGQEAWQHPMLTDWVFSKRKVNGVSVSVDPAVMVRKAVCPDVKIVFRYGALYLEKVHPGGGRTLYTLDGNRVTVVPRQ